MSDHTPSTGATPDSGESLAAYLAGDLDEVSARGLERRLATDADLREQLDDIHDTMLRLQRVDDVEPPADLAARVRARVGDVRETAAEHAADDKTAESPVAGGTAPETGHLHQRDASTLSHAVFPASDPTPWWRRPIAAVAALALLGVVALSSLVVGGVSGGEEGGATGEAGDAAMSAQGAEDRVAQEDAAEGGASGEAESGAADAGSTAAVEAATEAADDTADVPAAEAPQAMATVEGVVAIVDDLGSQDARSTYLDQVRGRPEIRDFLADESALDDVSIQRQRAALTEFGLEPGCIDRLVSTEPRTVQLLRTDFEGAETFGTVLAESDGTLTLRLVDPSDDCTVVLEQTG